MFFINKSIIIKIILLNIVVHFSIHANDNEKSLPYWVYGNGNDHKGLIKLPNSAGGNFLVFNCGNLHTEANLSYYWTGSNGLTSSDPSNFPGTKNIFAYTRSFVSKDFIYFYTGTLNNYQFILRSLSGLKNKSASQNFLRQNKSLKKYYPMQDKECGLISGKIKHFSEVSCLNRKHKIINGNISEKGITIDEKYKINLYSTGHSEDYLYLISVVSDINNKSNPIVSIAQYKGDLSLDSIKSIDNVFKGNKLIYDTTTNTAKERFAGLILKENNLIPCHPKKGHNNFEPDEYNWFKSRDTYHNFINNNIFQSVKASRNTIQSKLRIYEMEGNPPLKTGDKITQIDEFSHEYALDPFGHSYFICNLYGKRHICSYGKDAKKGGSKLNSDFYLTGEISEWPKWLRQCKDIDNISNSDRINCFLKVID